MNLVDNSKISREIIGKRLTRATPKRDLLYMLERLKNLELSAKNLYENALKSYSRAMDPETVKVVKRIMNDEMVHIKIAEQLISIVSSYDFKLEFANY